MAQSLPEALVEILGMKSCRVCKTRFEATRPFQPTCSYECSVSYAEKVVAKKRAKEAKEDRKQTKVRKEKLKTRSDYIKEAQIEFNKYIRLRDQFQPCICCARPLGEGAGTGGAFDCGHYRSVGSAPHLRFDPRNAHAQRKQCNRYGAGRAVDYRLGLIERIGAQAVGELEADQAPKHYTIEDLKAIKATYRQKAKELMK
jgi:hypothetical protein